MALELVVSPVQVTSPLAGSDNSLHDATVYIYKSDAGSRELRNLESQGLDVASRVQRGHYLGPEAF